MRNNRQIVWQSYKFQSLFLFILLIVTICWRAISIIDGPKVHSVEILSERDIVQVKHHFFNDLSLIVHKLRTNVSITQKDGMFYAFKEPRGILYFIWDDISQKEKETALTILGYSKSATSKELLYGPHPKWFTDSNFPWAPSCCPIISYNFADTLKSQYKKMYSDIYEQSSNRVNLERFSISQGKGETHLLPKDFLYSAPETEITIISKPQPPTYPPLARLTRSEGIVTVDIIINNQGCPVSVRAINGPPALQCAAVSYFKNCNFSTSSQKPTPPFIQFHKSYRFSLK